MRRSPRPAPQTIAFGVLGLAMLASALLLAYWGRGQTLGGDELAYATRLSHQSLSDAMVHPPPDGYLIAIPLVVYKAMFEVFGLASYLPYRALAIALVLLCAGLFYALARRRVGDLWALPPTIVLLFFGYGSESVLTAERLPGLIGLAAGLGMLLALTNGDPARDVLAALLLALSLFSHPLGLAFLVAAAVLVLTRPAPLRWRRNFVFLVPGLLYLAWWVLLRPSSTLPMQTRPGPIISFVWQSWTSTGEAVTGLAGIVDRPLYDHPAAWLLGAVLIALAIAGVVASLRRLPPTFWAAAAALLTLFATTALTRGNAFLMAFRPADTPRYLYPQAFLMLLLAVELIGAVRLTARGRLLVAVVLGLGLAANVARLVDAGREGRALAAPIKAAYGAVEIAREEVSPAYRPLGIFFPSAGNYLDVAHSFGSLSYSPEQLRGAPPAVRQFADQVLVGAMRLEVRGRRSRPAGASSRPPEAVPLTGRVEMVDRCVDLLPGARVAGAQAPVAPSPPPDTAAPPLAELVLPSGGVSIASRDLVRVGLRIGRFADPPVVPLATRSIRRRATLAIPGDGSALPWRVVVYARAPVEVCGLTPR